MHASDIAIAAAPLVVGMLSGLLVRRNNTCGKKAKLQPPGWLFAVVWPILYILAGIAGLLIWRADARRWSWVLTLFTASLLIMMTWWVVFGNVCAPKIATITIASIVTPSIATLIAVLMYRRLWTPAALLTPLFAWLCFASYLTYSSSSLT